MSYEWWREQGYDSRNDAIEQQRLDALDSMGRWARLCRWWSINWPIPITLGAIGALTAAAMGWLR